MTGVLCVREVLEYAEGGDALHYVQSAGALGEDRARTWSIQVTSAVTYMHDLGIAHRDLKLENLLLTGDLSTIKICDFGFVRQKTVISQSIERSFCNFASYRSAQCKSRPAGDSFSLQLEGSRYVCSHFYCAPTYFNSDVTNSLRRRC